MGNKTDIELAAEIGYIKYVFDNADSMTSVTMDIYINALEKLVVMKDID